MRRSVLFDLDGTLTDPETGISRSIRHALDALGARYPDDASLKTWIGPPLLESFSAWLKSDELAAKAVASYRERFSSVGLYENVLYPGIEQCLRELRDREFRLFVATSKPTVFAERIIDHFELRQFFDAVYGSELDGRLADKADLIGHVLDSAKLGRKETVMVGDRRHDMLGAAHHDVASIGVLWGFGSRDELESAGAGALCARVGELPTMI